MIEWLGCLIFIISQFSWTACECFNVRWKIVFFSLLAKIISKSTKSYIVVRCHLFMIFCLASKKTSKPYIYNAAYKMQSYDATIWKHGTTDCHTYHTNSHTNHHSLMRCTCTHLHNDDNTNQPKWYDMNTANNRLELNRCSDLHSSQYS